MEDLNLKVIEIYIKYIFKSNKQEDDYYIMEDCLEIMTEINLKNIGKLKGEKDNAEFELNLLNSYYDIIRYIKNN